MEKPSFEPSDPPAAVNPKWPRAFLWRRLHSLLGCWLILYLFEHLLVNSQMALFRFNGGASFIRLVTAIHELPYLPLIELLFLAIPFGIHALWGVIYLRTSQSNSGFALARNSYNKPHLPYPRNRAYSWQRITSWLLLFGIAAHVIHMRFLNYPQEVVIGEKSMYELPLNEDKELLAVVEKLNVTWDGTYARAPHAAPLFLLQLRQTFKNIWMVGLYSILVIATCFHAFNGLWTASIGWGITLTQRSQKYMRQTTNLFGAVTLIFGLMAIFGTYFSFWV